MGVGGGGVGGGGRIISCFPLPKHDIPCREVLVTSLTKSLVIEITR